MKKILISLVISGASLSAFATPIYDPDNGHYYDIIQSSGITWDAAKTAALSQYYNGLEGHLATITSAAEHTYVNTAIQLYGGGEMWAGGYQNPAGETDPQAGWTWLNGEGTFPGFNSTSPYAFWNNGEPNDAYGTASEQHLGLNLGPGFNDEGNLGNITGYVIEYDPNTIPGTPDAGSTLTLLGAAFGMLTAWGRRFRK